MKADLVLPLLHEYINRAYKKAFKSIDVSDEAIVMKTIELAPILILKNTSLKLRDEESSSESEDEIENERDSSIKTKGRIGNWFKFKTTKDEIEFKQLAIREIKKLWFELKSKPKKQIELNSIQYHKWLKHEFKHYFIWSYDELERYGVIDELEEYTSSGLSLDEAIAKLSKFQINFNDEFKSFFLYITSSGNLIHFSEQFYWMKNAYSLLLKPRIMKLIEENKEVIIKELMKSDLDND